MISYHFWLVNILGNDFFFLVIANYIAWQSTSRFLSFSSLSFDYNTNIYFIINMILNKYNYLNNSQS